ncbi:MAG TPA: transglycosylase SLT domain-containing protein [Candidatus Acidoferrum sp.]|nr:transglycosylase SLT domain-containing protein [Candidatus Acidoferrum sp.]
MRLTLSRFSRNSVIPSAARNPVAIPTSLLPLRPSQTASPPSVIPSAARNPVAIPTPLRPLRPSQTASPRSVIPSVARNPSSAATPLRSLRLSPTALLVAATLLLFLAASPARAEYIVLRSGERLHVTGYQLLGDKYRLQMPGGWVEVTVADVVGIEPEDVFKPIPPPPPGLQSAVAPYTEIVSAAASKYGVDADLISSVIAVESNFDPKAVSRKNARGLMQLLPETADRFGVKNIFDPAENIDAGTRYLKELLQMYNNDLTLTLAAYNAGPDRVQQYGTVPPFRETMSYVRRVKTSYAKTKSSAPAKPPAPNLFGLNPATLNPSAPNSPTPNTVPSTPRP